MGAEGTRSAANKWFDDTTYGTPACDTSFAPHVYCLQK